MCQPGRPRPHGLSSPNIGRGQEPQHEIARVLLVGRHLDAGAGDHFVQVAPRQRAVARHRWYIERRVPVGRIRMTALDQPRDHRLHVGDVRGRPRLHRRVEAAHCPHVLAIGARGALGERRDRLAGHPMRGDDLVVDIGDVAGVGHVRVAIEMAQQPEQHVEDDRRPSIADVRVVVNGGSAHVHAHVVGIERLETLLLAAEGVEEVRCHRLSARRSDRPRRFRRRSYRKRRSAARRPINGSRARRSGPWGRPVNASRSGRNSPCPCGRWPPSPPTSRHPRSPRPTARAAAAARRTRRTPHPRSPAPPRQSRHRASNRHRRGDADWGAPPPRTPGRLAPGRAPQAGRRLPRTGSHAGSAGSGAGVGFRPVSVSPGRIA